MRSLAGPYVPERGVVGTRPMRPTTPPGTYFLPLWRTGSSWPRIAPAGKSPVWTFT